MLDERTTKYFESLKVNLGYLGSNYGHNDIRTILEKNGALETANLQEVTTYDGYVNSSDIVIYSYLKDGELRYCAELSYRAGIDDYCIETHIFKKIPTRKEVMDFRELDNLEFKFKYENLHPEFRCWECGKYVHWLDAEGDFQKKKDMFKEKYCGC